MPIGLEPGSFLNKRAFSVIFYSYSPSIFFQGLILLFFLAYLRWRKLILARHEKVIRSLVDNKGPALLSETAIPLFA